MYNYFNMCDTEDRYKLGCVKPKVLDPNLFKVSTVLQIWHANYSSKNDRRVYWGMKFRIFSCELMCSAVSVCCSRMACFQNGGEWTEVVKINAKLYEANFKHWSLRGWRLLFEKWFKSLVFSTVWCFGCL